MKWIRKRVDLFLEVYSLHAGHHVVTTFMIVLHCGTMIQSSITVVRLKTTSEIKKHTFD